MYSTPNKKKPTEMWQES